LEQAVSRGKAGGGAGATPPRASEGKPRDACAAGRPDIEDPAGATAWSGLLGIVPKRWACGRNRRNRETTAKREVVSMMRKYYVKVFRQMFSMAVLVGFLSAMN